MSERRVDGARGWSGDEAHQARRLGVVLALTGAFVTLELAGALAARSQVLLADGLHLLLDVFALGLSIVAMRVAVRPPSDRFTFGLRRVDALAATLNGLLVAAVACAIGAEGVATLGAPSSPRPTLMLVVAVAALAVHGVSAWLIHDAIQRRGPSAPHAHGDAGPHGHGHALNLRGVWLHLVGDVLGALAALVAALVIRLGGPALVDPLGSLLVALVLLVAAVKLLRDAGLVLLEAAPAHLPTRAVRDVVRAERGVVDIAHLRVWAVGAGHDAVAVRVRTDAGDAALAGRIRRRLHDELGVEFITVEVTGAE